MNERIKQLAEQALQLVADEHTGGDESRLNTDSYHVKDLIQEKFAELILKECLGIVEECHEKAVDWGWDTDYAMCTARDDIEKHFGVKE